MPSTKDPQSTVQAGPGLLPAGVVPASALLFIPGGGASAALQAHINNPHDAHMAHAIGVDPFYPPGIGPTPDPILTSVGGVVDGESVLDFINQFKDLIPPRPNSIGFAAAAGGTGVPNWDTLGPDGVLTGTTITGGYASAPGTGQPVTFTHFIARNSATTFSPSGLLFPADRGVLAFYVTTAGNYFNSGQTTLVAALSLNDTAPLGIPNGAFNESLRQVQQTNYTGAGAGLDFFNLTFRLPYLKDYTPYPGTPYGPFGLNFFSYQLAEWTLQAQALPVGNAQSFLMVHWKETYATSLTSIQPTNLTLGHLTTTNAYSAVPVGGNFDDNTAPVYNVNRHNVFRDSLSASTPTGTLFTSSPNGSPTTIFLSGVQYYSVASGAGHLAWTVDIRATSLFDNAFQTGSSDNPPQVPAQFHSAFDPIQMDFSNFGGALLPVPYNAMNKFGGAGYTHLNSPEPGDTGEYTNSALVIPSPVAFCPVGGFAQLTAVLHSAYHQTVYVDPNRYLFDTYAAGALSTTTFEPFVDELYRYINAFDPTSSSTVPIVPAGGNIFPSASALVGGGNSLQVVGQELVYPQTNYNVATFLPTQAIDYSGFPGGDGVNHLRRYQRAVDTGGARNTGWIRLRGLAQAAFTTNAAYNGTETTGHLTGGAIIQLKVPGGSGTGWLDLGRQYGDPGIATLDFYGCQTGVVIFGSDIYVSFNTTAFTSNNGSGNFLLFVRVTFINGPGTGLILDQFEWFPPTFVPP